MLRDGARMVKGELQETDEETIGTHHEPEPWRVLEKANEHFNLSGFGRR